MNVTPYVTTLFAVVAVGSMAATLPVAAAPVSAFQVTVAACPTFSLVASASAKAAETCSLVRSASSMKPEDEDESDRCWTAGLTAADGAADRAARRRRRPCR